MKKQKNSESGQALILIVFAIIGLIGMTGLTVDGGIAFSDKRNAQNAADTAALAAGRMMIRANDWDVAQAAGFDLAANNGYNNNGTTNIVQVVRPPIEGLYAGDDDYVQVLITSHVQTTFARVVGITEMTNYVNAVAKVIPPTKVNMFEGNAVVGLSPDQCKAVKYQGNADTTLD
ncbi:MAG: pilus assembly protein TadG-related protein, partial [Chloroflexota bacterium]